MSELKPCPFCGSEAEKLTSIDGFTSIGCLNCNPFFGVMIQRNTEAEAIAALNSRADYHGYEQAAIEAWESIKAWNSRAERTCHIEHVKGGAMYDVWRCSTCGYEYAESVSEKGIVQNYCPNCGAKVRNK